MPDCNVAKVIIGVTNGLVIVGALVAGIVLYSKAGGLSYKDFADATFAAEFLLAVALLAIIAAIFGLLAVCVTKKCVRLIYFGFVFVVLVLEAVGIAIAYLYPAKVEGTIQKEWRSHKFADVVANLEHKFHCCGWDNQTYSDKDLSSCALPNATEGTPNCRDEVNNLIKEYQTEIAVALIALVVFQLVLVGCAIYLLCAKPEERDITKF
jgi:hypothetical protein